MVGGKLENAENIAKCFKSIQGDYYVIRFAETEMSSLRDNTIDAKETFN
jgi:hypothetical protein